MKFGLIGHPISHSMSPALFRAAYHDSESTYDLIETSDFNEAMSIFKRDYDAINVTSPFKELAFEKADESDTITKILGVSNLLIKKREQTNGKEKIFAYNTDFWAVSQLLRLNIPPGKKPDVMIFGCGGAGKAAALAALNLHLNVYITNRDYKKAVEYCKKIGDKASAIPLESVKIIFDKLGIIIYTLPTKIDIIDQLNFKGKIILEANYKDPVFSPGSSADNTYETVYLSGKKWLTEQAITGFNLMTHISPDEESMKSVFTE
jgi:shikimate 5-dehydrogenase